MEIKKINTTPGAADSAREGGEKINANFAAVKEELEALDMNKITAAQCEAIVKTISYTKAESDTRYPTYIIDGEVIISVGASVVTDINEL